MTEPPASYTLQPWESEITRRIYHELIASINEDLRNENERLRSTITKAQRLVSDQSGMVVCWHEPPDEECVQCVLEQEAQP